MKSILALVVVLLAGCSSAPKTPVSQFCHTSKTIEVQDGENVSSKTIVKCSDDLVDRLVIAKTGIAQNCGEFKYYMTLKGQPVERRAYSCKKWDGTWEIVPNSIP